MSVPGGPGGGRGARLARAVRIGLLALCMAGARAAVDHGPVAHAQGAPTTAPGGVGRVDGVWYEIFVRSFQDSDGDGIGDLAGVRERLPYLAELGVTGIWLMPIHPSPSYHGYDVTDYLAVNPDYGSLEDVRALIADAHALGIRVALDLVANHTSVLHPWFRAAAAGDPAYRDLYVWSDTRPDWRGTRGGPAWHPLDPAAAGGPYYLGLFSAAMPDLNYRGTRAMRELRKVVAFWLAQGVDGFRVDAIQHIIEGRDGTISNTAETVAWVRSLEGYLHALRPDAFLIGETWTDMPAIRRYLVDGDLDVAFDYPAWKTLLGAVQARSAADLAGLIEQEGRLFPSPARLATFLANHDQQRPASTLSFVGRDVPRMRLAAGLLLTLPGTPFLYYGEEIGLANGPGADDLAKRTPMRWRAGPGAGFTDGTPWTAFSTEETGIDVAAERADPTSLWWTYRTLIALRRLHPALARGDARVLNVGPRALLALWRAADDERLLVLANLGTRPVTVPTASLELGAGVDLIGGERVGAGRGGAGEITVAPLGVRVVRPD